VPNPALAAISLGIGEPRHATPALIEEAIVRGLAGLSKYPATLGEPALREAIAGWVQRRYGVALDAATQVLPVTGSREALFAFAQTVIDATKPGATVICPNPFYQIYEGAALLAGAQPYFLNTTQQSGFLPDFNHVPEEIWAQCQLLYICSPGNPTGAVMPAETHRQLIELAERFDFIIASDECYSELYNDEYAPPTGLLQTAWEMGNTEFKRCVVFHSLSKRSNAPGLRSGFVAGDATILSRFLLYRTYHGTALSVPVQCASLAAWQDEDHVVANRALYRQKFAAVTEILGEALPVTIPAASFYLWPRIHGDDQEFARALYADKNVTVLPGSYLSRDHFGVNPGRGYVRMALVAPLDECVDAAHRIRDFIQTHSHAA
jgi:N-succinyldiaminopimelate aminotransferase